MKKFIKLFLISIFMLGCSGNEKEIKKPDEANFCTIGCRHLEQLGCEEGQPLLTPVECTSTAECPDGTCINGYCGVSCVQFCEQTIYNGMYLGAKCWSEINSCGEINFCGDEK